jgi:3-hydroxyisobutyrate dehydrogenase-like beta-hydroxyacid dehydrogenase
LSDAHGSTVGVVGLGAMGSELASALLDAGYTLCVFDTRASAVASSAQRGAEVCTSARAVADRAPIVLTSLPTPAVVKEVAAEIAQGSVIRTLVEVSTTGRVAREVASIMRRAGVEFLDAPVTGGITGARARKLTVLTAGRAETFEQVQPILQAFAEVIVRVGDEPGQGQTAKLLNNLLSATALVATSEALTMGRRAGLRPEPLLEAFNAGSGRNTATSAKFPNFVLGGGFDSGFRLRLMLKDVQLCLAEARELEHPMVLGSLVEQLWGLAAQATDAEADHTEIVRLFEGWSGTEVRST